MLIKIFTITLAFTSLGLGLVAARYWLKASSVKVMPLYEKVGMIEPVIPEHAIDGRILGIWEAGMESSRLNVIAAKWTAASVFAGCITTVVGVLWL